MSKGSQPRPYSVPMEQFNESFDRIFGTKKQELICPRCLIDRLNSGCPGPLHMCPMIGDAQNVPDTGRTQDADRL